MSATEELRSLLDERGVEWSKPADEYWVLLGGAPTSDYVTIVGETSIDEATDGTLVVCRVTPAQAVEAILGRGECHSTTPDNAWCFSCSSCGKSFPRHELHIAHNHGEINYCPNCGRKVVEQ